jgi:N4-gp56 family major capsid protein
MKLSVSDATLTEGVTPDSSDNIVSTISVEPVLLGAYTYFTDKLTMETLFDIIPAQGRELFNNAKRVIDEKIQEVLEDYQSVPVIYAGSATARDELTAADTLDLDLVMQGTTFLAAQGETTERFKTVMHPNVFLNFAQSSSTNTWLNKTIYENFKGVEDGYVTSILNFDIYVSANVKPFVVDADTDFNVYPTYIFRKGAYGTTSLKDLQTIYKPYGSGGTGDPLDQRASIGWKAYFGCAVLNPFFLVRLETRATTDYQWQKTI